MWRGRFLMLMNNVERRYLAFVLYLSLLLFVSSFISYTPRTVPELRSRGRAACDTLRPATTSLVAGKNILGETHKR